MAMMEESKKEQTGTQADVLKQYAQFDLNPMGKDPEEVKRNSIIYQPIYQNLDNIAALEKFKAHQVTPAPQNPFITEESTVPD